MNEKVISVLQDLKLNEKEIQIYLAILKLGTARSSTLGKITKIQRSTAKYTCEQLLKKGLISMHQQNNAFIYTVEPLHKLLALLDMQKQELDETEAEIQSNMKELRSLYNPETSFPKVKFYEGRESMTELLEEMLNSKTKELLHISDMEITYDQLFQKYKDAGYVKSRVKKGIPVKYLGVRNEKSEKAKKADKKEIRETRFLPEKYNVSSTMIIYNDIVVLISKEKEPICIRINSEELANTMRAHFTIMWDKAEKE